MEAKSSKSVHEGEPGSFTGDKNQYGGAIETAEEFGKRIYHEAGLSRLAA